MSTPRGLALKVLEADGPRLEPADGLREQDFLLVNGPVFNAPTAKKFLRSFKLLAATTDKAPNAKKLLSGALRALEAVVEKAGGESSTLKALGGHPETHPLGETYFTQVPMLLGPIWCACRSRMHRSNGPRTCRPTRQSPASASSRSCHGMRQARLPRTINWPSALGAGCRRIAP